MDNIKRKNIVLVIVIVLIAILLVGGTFAWLTFSFNATNGNYAGTVECFDINYSINNDDGTQDITGTLFPSAIPSKGLFGKVSLNVSSSCNVTGTGTLYLHLNSATSSTLVQNVKEHCEDDSTLETLTQYSNSSTCTNAGNIWVTNGTGLKYAVYSSSDTTGAPVSSGYVTSSSLGTDLILFDNFSVGHTQLNYYIYIWLDGYVTDDTYAGLPFNGYIHAKVVQDE